MARLGDLAASHYPDLKSLLTETGRLTVWGRAYRYPGLGDEPEPSPDALRGALATIERLVDHLRALLAAGDAT